jgi:quinol monooxygenase YgiN
MIIVSAKIIFTSQSDRDRAVEVSTPIQQATRNDEIGCQAYCFSADPCDPVAIQVYELWENSESLVAHFDHPNYVAMLEALSSLGLVDSINCAYLTERNEPVYGPDFTKKTEFFV